MNNENELSVGERLKQLRLEKNLTLEQVHKKTKIPLKILEALEEGRLININPVYIRGFLKMYCNLLGVNPDEYIRGFQKTTVEVQHPKKEQPLISGLKVKVSMFGKTEFKIKIAIIIGLLFILGLVIFGWTNIIKRSRASLEKKTPAPDKVEVTKPVTATTSIKVTIHAKEDCWIKATVDGKIVFQNILKKGRFETWKAKDKIELSLGNAGGIELDLNGKLFSPLGRRGQVVRNVLINKEGLRVLR